MTFTKEEIETALAWHRRTDDNYIQCREILGNAAHKAGFCGSYSDICEHILHTTIKELYKPTNDSEQ